jgi:hypothetical protein
MYLKISLLPWVENEPEHYYLLFHHLRLNLLYLALDYFSEYHYLHRSPLQAALYPVSSQQVVPNKDIENNNCNHGT